MGLPRVFFLKQPRCFDISIFLVTLIKYSQIFRLIVIQERYLYPYSAPATRNAAKVSNCPGEEICATVPLSNGSEKS